VKSSLLVGDKDVVLALKKGVTFVIKNQADNGRFVGHAGPYTIDTPFITTRVSPTIFFTSLIMTCLQNVSGTKTIRSNAARFLLSQRSDNWRWNYWIRGSRIARKYPYPDDLDDISCALSALGTYDLRLIDGNVLGHLAQSLIDAETQTGGPYRTWLHSEWKSIDLAVNANIGFLLSQHNVTTPGLNTYIADHIKLGAYTSEFYVGSTPVLYFISRWYTGERCDQLRQSLIDQIDEINHTQSANNALFLSMLITSCCNQMIQLEFILPLVKQLLALQAKGHWRAEALYQDPHIDGTDLYAGSATLTTAFALESLQAYRAYARNSNVKAIDASKSIEPESNTHHEGQSLLVQQYNAYHQKFLIHNNIPEITEIATITAAACGKDIPNSIITNLNEGSLSGWIAYSIYDGFLDGDSNPQLLGVANKACRNMQQSFASALPKGIALPFQELVSQTLDQVDQANIWEVIHARAKHIDSTVTISQLPDYDRNQQLAYKSLGHMLASCGVLSVLGYRNDDPEIKRFKKFFFHYLIARQLNDDAHDWESDLLEGRISPIVCILLRKETLPIHITPADIPRLRQKFWESTIILVDRQIKQHVTQARTALASCTFLASDEVFMTWINRLESASAHAVKESMEAKKFISAFSGTTDNKSNTSR
jgi:hypothetical protein